MWPSNYPQFVPNSPQSPKISFYIKYKRTHVALRSVIENKTRCQCQRKHTDAMSGLLRYAKGNDWVGCINCTKTQIKRTSLSSFRSSCSTSPNQKGQIFHAKKQGAICTCMLPPGQLYCPTCVADIAEDILKNSLKGDVFMSKVFPTKLKLFKINVPLTHWGFSI